MVYDEAIPLEYTVHAIVAMYERNILAEWVQRVVNAPTLRLPDPHDTELERFFARYQKTKTVFCVWW